METERPLIVNRRKFFLGLAMACSFFALFALMFRPLFDGKNAFESADGLFNSITMDSVSCWPELHRRARSRRGRLLTLNLELDEEAMDAAGELLAAAGASARREGALLAVRGDEEAIMLEALRDAEAMYNQHEEEIVRRRGGRSGRLVLYRWWQIFRGMERALKRQRNFADASQMHEIMVKGIEVGYNFRGIRPAKAADNVLLLAFLLLFYVVYTAWWGFALMFLVEGFGLRLSAENRGGH